MTPEQALDCARTILDGILPDNVSLFRQMREANSLPHDSYMAFLGVDGDIIGVTTRGNFKDEGESDVITPLELVGTLALAHAEEPNQADISAVAEKLGELIAG